MTCEFTWPQHLMASDRDAVETIISQHGFQDDVAYGNNKLFVRTPQTLFTLEQERATLIPILVLFLQKVRPDLVMWSLGCDLAHAGSPLPPGVARRAGPHALPPPEGRLRHHGLLQAPQGEGSLPGGGEEVC